MKTIGSPAFLIFLCLVGSASLAAQPLRIGDLKDGLLLGPHLKIFEDKSGSAKWEDVITGKHDADFKAQNKAIPNFGSTRSVIWAVVDLEFSSPFFLKNGERGKEYLLELSHPVLDYVDVWVLGSKGKVLRLWKTGSLRPFDSRPIDHRNFLFPLPLIPSGPTASGLPDRVPHALRIALRLSTESSLLIPLKIWRTDTFQDKAIIEGIFLGVFYGILLVMIVYNLLIASAMKTLSGYLYSLYMLFFLLFNLAGDGLLSQLIPELTGLTRLIIPLAMTSVSFAILFSLKFLGVNRQYLKSLVLMASLIVAGLIAIIMSLAGYYSLGLRTANFVGGAGSVGLLMLGIFRMHQKFHPARYFVFGFGFVLSGTIIFNLTRTGILSGDSLFFIHAIKLGAALEAILLSFGLADRIRLIQKEKELAQAATIEQQRVLNEAFARFVPTPFLQILGKKSIPEVLLGDYTEREMTILFADIRGFTTISEKLTPKATFNFINEYLHNTGPVIRKNGGFIDKYMGDGIMALFEKREEAITAALRLQARNARLNRSLQGRMVSEINVGIGIHTGHLMLGTIGEPQRMDGTVISDAVNLASRVESLTKQYGVNLLVTKETLAGMQLGTPEFPWIRRFIDRIAVKGKSEPTTIYEVVALKHGKATKYSKNWLLAWNEAMRLYYTREFAAAMKIMARLLRKNPGDKTAELFIKRSEDYSVNPPGESWIGVAVAQSK